MQKVKQNKTDLNVLGIIRLNSESKIADGQNSTTPGFRVTSTKEHMRVPIIKKVVSITNKICHGMKSELAIHI